MKETLEQYIDMHGLDFVLQGLADICDEKAEHLRGNWQDERSARHWDRFRNIIERAIARF
jgi:hypothetical protein